MKKNVVIFGASGHSKQIIDIFERGNKYTVVGLIDTYKEVGAEILGYKVIGNEEDLPTLVNDHSIVGGIIAIGDNWTRYKFYKKILSIKSDFRFINAIHPSAQVGKNVQIGKGVALMAGAIINSDSSIGDNSFINTNSSLGHDSIMDDFSSLAPNVATGGNCKIGKYCAISIGANIIHGITIGDQVVVGAGALVLKDISEFSVVYGVPAKVIRSRVEGEKYL